jgi:hypothetical protein
MTIKDNIKEIKSTLDSVKDVTFNKRDRIRLSDKINNKMVKTPYEIATAVFFIRKFPPCTLLIQAYSRELNLE